MTGGQWLSCWGQRCPSVSVLECSLACICHVVEHYVVIVGLWLLVVCVGPSESSLEWVGGDGARWWVVLEELFLTL